MANGICKQFKADGVVCPVNLRKNLFTMAAYGNVYHNPSTTTAKNVFMELPYLYSSILMVITLVKKGKKYFSLPLHQKKRLN